VYRAKIGETIQLFLDTVEVTRTKIPTKGLGRFINHLQIGDSLLIADGQIKLRISEKLTDRLICIVEASGQPFRPNRSINFPDSGVRYSCLTEADVDNLRRSATLPQVKYFGLSFLEDPNDVLRAKQIISTTNPSSELKIVAKIETKRGIINLNEIAKVTDCLMAARGDLKLEAPYHELLSNQLNIINTARRYNKYCIIATQLLDSMLNSLVPSASDITALGYTVLCGADAVMVSEETAIGEYPLETLKVMHNIILAAEKLKRRSNFLFQTGLME
jgi:pyruvate kinase